MMNSPPRPAADRQKEKYRQKNEKKRLKWGDEK
jgi:hypothetical protein